MRLQASAGIDVHRAELEHAQRPAVASNAFLNIERWTRVDELDGERQDGDDRRQQQCDRGREDDIDHTLEYLIVPQVEIAPDLNSDRVAQRPGVQPQALNVVHIVDQHEPARRHPRR